jgi:hypothetical protein
MQQPEVAARDADDGRHDGFIVESLVWQDNTCREPLMPEHVTDPCGTEEAKGVHETDTRIELR